MRLMQAAGPVACASRGWVLVDVDLICCEICGSYLSFPVPPCWSQYQGISILLSFLYYNDLNVCCLYSTLNTRDWHLNWVGGLLFVNQKWRMQHKCLLSSWILLTRGCVHGRTTHVQTHWHSFHLHPFQLCWVPTLTGVKHCWNYLLSQWYQSLPSIRCSIMVVRLINCCPNQLIQCPGFLFNTTLVPVQVKRCCLTGTTRHSIR